MQNWNIGIYLIVVAIICSSPLIGDEYENPYNIAKLGEYEGESINLPQTVSTKLKRKYVEETEDEEPITRFLLVSDSINFHTIDPSNWQYTINSRKNESIKFIHRHNPNSSITFSVFEKSSIKWKLSTQTMYQILAGIHRNTNYLNLEFISMPPSFTPSGYFEYLLGSKTFIANYKYQEKSDRETWIQTYTYYFTSKKHLIVASITGNVATFNPYKQQLDHLLQNLWVTEE